MTLLLDQCEHLYRFIWSDLIDHKCELLRINGMQNHLHLFINLHPTVALATLMRDIKSHATGWLNKDDRFPSFEGWAKEYYAATVSAKDKDAVIDYIKCQREHHLRKPFDDELIELYRAGGQNFDARDLR